MAAELEKLFPTESEVPEAYRHPPAIRQTGYLIDGRIDEWSGPMQEIQSPICIRRASGLAAEKLGETPMMTPEASLTVLDAAVCAYDNGRGRWPTMSVSDRIRHVEQFAFAMKEKKRAVVSLLMWEIGKTWPDSEREFDRTVAYISDTIEALKELDRASSRFTLAEGILAQVRRAPLGVALCMGPYNYPLNETFTVLIPALIMGNTVVFKPAKHGVLLHQPLLDAFRDSFPPGTIGTVYGDGAGIIGPLMKSGKVDVLGFIGSSKVADVLKDQHPQPHRLRSVLGLGAKNPAIILADADLDLAVKECVLGSLSYNGQRCTALKMLFVHTKVAEEFAARFGAAVEKLRCGMPWEEGVTITPLAVPGKPRYLAELVDDAVRQGARVVNDGGARAVGTFFTPAVLYPISLQARVAREEQFGPVVPVVPFEDIATPIRWVQESPYGQQVSLFGRDAETLARLIDPLVNQVCRVNVNSQCQRGPDTFPFTGRKDSAEGTLSVTDALRVFSIRTLVAAKQTAENKEILTSIVRGRRSSFLSTDFLF